MMYSRDANVGLELDIGVDAELDRREPNLEARQLGEGG